MEVNLSHPLIKNLWERHQKDIKDPWLQRCILQLYEGAVLLEGNLTESVHRAVGVEHDRPAAGRALIEGNNAERRKPNPPA